MSATTIDMVGILDATTGDLLSTCDGPASDGTCPWVPPDGIVPCAGARVVSTLATTARFALHVPSESTQCPLAWLMYGMAG